MTALPGDAPADPPPPQPPTTLGRRVARILSRHPRLQLPLLLAGPIGWLVVAYLGSLALLLVQAFWRVDAFTGLLTQDWSLDNFAEVVGNATYRTVALKTVGMAAAVTLTCAILAFPIAFYMARMAGSRTRGLLIVSILLPLWSSYLVKVYAWRILLQQGGLVNSAFGVVGLSGPGYGDIALWLVFSYLWLPYMILPIYAGLERIPASLLEASSDLGGRGLTTFRRIVLPLALPAVVAGSIFTFSLTLGDYIAPKFVSSTELIGNVVASNVGTSGNVPFASAYATVPIVVMLLYLIIARRLGAFESL